VARCELTNEHINEHTNEPTNQQTNTTDCNTSWALAEVIIIIIIIIILILVYVPDLNFRLVLTPSIRSSLFNSNELCEWLTYLLLLTYNINVKKLKFKHVLTASCLD